MMRPTTVLLLFALASPLPVPAAPASTADELRGRLAVLVEQRDEEPLEELMGELRSSPTFLDDGSTALGTAYATLSRLLAVDRPPSNKKRELSGLLARWRENRPASVAAAILHVLVLSRQTDPQTHATHRFLRSEADVPAPIREALRAGAAPGADPHAWVALFICTDDLGWTDEERGDLLRRALASDVDYPPLVEGVLAVDGCRARGFDHIAEALMPLRVQALLAAAPAASRGRLQARAAAVFDDNLGPERTAWYVLPQAPALASGVVQILASDEGRGKGAWAMARVAALMGDRDLASKAISRAGEPVVDESWNGVLRDWASGTGPLPPTWFVDPRR